MAVEVVIQAIRADRVENIHPEHVGMLTVRRRYGVCEKDTCVGQSGEIEGMFAIQPLDFIEAAGSSGRGGEELEGGNGDGGSRVGETLLVRRRLAWIAGCQTIVGVS